MNHSEKKIYSLADTLIEKTDFSTSIKNGMCYDFMEGNNPDRLSIEIAMFTELAGVLVIDAEDITNRADFLSLLLKSMKVIAEWVHSQEEPYLILGENLNNNKELIKLLFGELKKHNLVILEEPYTTLFEHSEYELVEFLRTNDQRLPVLLPRLYTMEKEWGEFRRNRKTSRIYRSSWERKNFFEPCLYSISILDKKAKLNVSSTIPFQTEMIVYDDDDNQELVTFINNKTEAIFEFYSVKIEEHFRLYWLLDNNLIPSSSQLMRLGLLNKLEIKKVEHFLAQAGFTFLEIDYIFIRINHLVNHIKDNIKRLVQKGDTILREKDLTWTYIQEEDFHVFDIVLGLYSFTLKSHSIKSLSLFVEHLVITKNQK